MFIVLNLPRFEFIKIERERERERERESIETICKRKRKTKGGVNDEVRLYKIQPSFQWYSTLIYKVGNNLQLLEE